MTRYIGNGHYCYANATAMLLAAAGEPSPADLIEVLSGVGLGAALQEGTTTPWFSNLHTAPDRGISKALELLGWGFVEQAATDDAAAPIEDLRAALAQGPAVLGPVDMGYLSYVPYHAFAEGADHFVLALAIEDNAVLLHDPAGFPYVTLPLEQLTRAWRAERIPYRRGAFRMWTAPRRERQPDEDELWARACEWFAQCYRETDAIAAEQRFGAWRVGSDALRAFAGHIRSGEVSEATRGHLIDFGLPLGARRADDYALYFSRHDAQLAAAKRRQAELFGRGHVQATNNDWPALAATIDELAAVEDAIRAGLQARASETKPAEAGW